jgi:hypothetical protein
MGTLVPSREWAVDPDTFGPTVDGRCSRQDRCDRIGHDAVTATAFSVETEHHCQLSTSHGI